MVTPATGISWWLFGAVVAVDAALIVVACRVSMRGMARTPVDLALLIVLMLARLAGLFVLQGTPLYDQIPPAIVQGIASANVWALWPILVGYVACLLLIAPGQRLPGRLRRNLVLGAIALLFVCAIAFPRDWPDWMLQLLTGVQAVSATIVIAIVGVALFRSDSRRLALRFALALMLWMVARFLLRDGDGSSTPGQALALMALVGERAFYALNILFVVQKFHTDSVGDRGSGSSLPGPTGPLSEDNPYAGTATDRND